jgi:protoporphyrinogen/coproporphyrinogen III oxidase
MQSRLDAAVVGAGIAGLAAAHRLHALGFRDVLVLEASGRVGGKLSAVEVAGRSLDAGPDSFITRNPAARDLCKELGLAGDLVAPAALGAQLWVRGRLRPIPRGMTVGVPRGAIGLALSGTVSLPGLARAALERLLPPNAPPGDLSVGELLRARFGDEAFEAVVDPLVSGIFAGDADRLSAEAVVPHLIGALRAGRPLSSANGQAAVGPGFLTLRGGLSSLTTAITRRLPAGAIRTGAAVLGIDRVDGGYRLHGISGEPVDARSVVLATPPAATASLLGQLADAPARLVGGIETASVATVTMKLRSVTLPASTGFLVPRSQRRMLVGCTFLTRKWPHIADGGGGELVRCAVGRDGDSRWEALDDDELVDAVTADLRQAIRAPVEPEAVAIRRFRDGIPQYRVGHLELVNRIKAELRVLPGLAVAGSAYGGVGLPACIASGREAAEQVASSLRTVPA